MTVTHPCHSGPMGFGEPGYDHIADTMCMASSEGYNNNNVLLNQDPTQNLTLNLS